MSITAVQPLTHYCPVVCITYFMQTSCCNSTSHMLKILTDFYQTASGEHKCILVWMNFGHNVLTPHDSTQLRAGCVFPPGISPWSFLCVANNLFFFCGLCCSFSTVAIYLTKTVCNKQKYHEVKKHIWI